MKEVNVNEMSEECYQALLKEMKEQHPEFDYYDEWRISFKGVKEESKS